jgi:multicomponent Na+:H+ antiporter subunit A
MLAGPVALAAASLIFGVAPLLAEDLVKETVASIATGAPKVSLTLWHGFNLPLLLSGVSIGSGAALLAVGPRIAPFTAAAAAGRGLPRPSAAYETSLTALTVVAREHTRVLQHGYLRIYLAVVLVASAALVVAPLAIRGGLDPSPDWSWPSTYEAMIAGVVLAGAGTAVASTSRLTAVVALGLVGFGVALVYALFGAPDLALTQFLVETLTVLLFVLVFYRLPRVIDRSLGGTRLRDAVLAVGFGSLMTLLVLASLERSLAEPISAYFAENSVTAAFGRNVVNVILVDFRALDTLGEIIVLAIAALGVLALLRLRRGGSA